MTHTEIPRYVQIADAEHRIHRALVALNDARAAVAAARAAYDHARRADPAAQTTDLARHAWVEALHDRADAQAAAEQAGDELAALTRGGS